MRAMYVRNTNTRRYGAPTIAALGKSPSSQPHRGITVGEGATYDFEQPLAIVPGEEHRLRVISYRSYIA